jgi:hypothetical protein
VHVVVPLTWQGPASYSHAITTAWRAAPPYVQCIAFVEDKAVKAVNSTLNVNLYSHDLCATYLTFRLPSKF